MESDKRAMELSSKHQLDMIEQELRKQAKLSQQKDEQLIQLEKEYKASQTKGKNEHMYVLTYPSNQIGNE